MTHKQARWAEQHDWHRDTVRYGEHALVVVADIGMRPNGQVRETRREFGNFKALREWAGY